LGVLKPETYEGQEYKPVFALAVGLMEIENLFRYAALAVGLKPSANQGKARLRGRERIICSKTISPPEALSYGLLSIGYSSAPRQALLSVIGYRLSAISYQLSATISSRLWKAKPACAGYTHEAAKTHSCLHQEGDRHHLSRCLQCHFDDTLLQRLSTGSAVAFCSPRNPGAGFTRLSSDAEKIMNWRRDCPGRSPGDATATAEQAWSENDRPPGSALLPVTPANNMP